MAAKGKAKKKAVPGEGVPPEAPEERRKLPKPTVVHMVYHPEGKVVSVGVHQDVKLAGETQRASRDVQIPIDDLDAATKRALDTAFKAVAKKVGAAAW